MHKVTYSPLSAAEVEELEKFRRQAERNKETSRRSQAKTREQRKARGLCAMCGKAKAQKGHTCCAACADRFRSRQEQRKAKAWEKRKSLPGFCSTCGHKLREHRSMKAGER
ncbi:MAG: hypothetical protein KGL39_15985 [Patescibacteria group bacterium]|nr:hypothetical protein [Patescibacteria group bacterium]